MTRRFRALLTLPVAAAVIVGLAACGSKDGQGHGGAPAPAASSALSVPGVQDQLVGTWVAATYQGRDGTVQQLDVNDPSARITYTFDRTTLTIDWGGKGTDRAPYEWYLSDRDANIQTVVVHVPASGSGDTEEIGTEQATDVHYDVALFELDAARRPTRLRLTVRETGEITTLQRTA